MAFSTFQLLYITLAIDKMDGCGLSNTACRECLPKKTKVTQYWLQKDYPIKTRCSASVVKVSGQISNNF